MLVLTRRPDEVIQIGDDIQLEVLEIRGQQVRLGIQAPAEVTILRDELTRQERPRGPSCPGSRA